MHFFVYLFYNLFATPHVWNDYFVHSQQFIIYCICSSVQTMRTCLTARSYVWNCLFTELVTMHGTYNIKIIPTCCDPYFTP